MHFYETIQQRPPRKFSSLTKTDYLEYLRCPPEFWLSFHMPSETTPDGTLEYEHLRQQARDIEALVKELDRFRPASNDVTFDRTFETTDLSARADIAVNRRGRETVIDLYQIRASWTVRDEHLDDITFLRLVANKAGFDVGRCHLITINRNYVRRGALNPEEIFVVSDVSKEVDLRLEITEYQAKEAVLYLQNPPSSSLSDYCVEKGLDCAFIKMNFPGLPEYTVLDIARLGHEKRRQLLGKGIVSISDVPDDFPLSTKQRVQVEAAKTGTVFVDRRSIASKLKKWDYPLHFLDYETFGYPIPKFEGTRPFQQICIQYSLHTIDFPGAPPRHSLYTSTGDDDPPRSIAAQLEQVMNPVIGTVVVWYEPFAKTRNIEMAEMFPELTAFLEGLNDRTVDLMKIFSDGLYVHPDFKGRSSIKKILPVLVPDLTYAPLEISNGLTASLMWYRAVTQNNLEKRRIIFDDLAEYGTLDTLATVKVFEYLYDLVRDDS